MSLIVIWVATGAFSAPPLPEASATSSIDSTPGFVDARGDVSGKLSKGQKKNKALKGRNARWLKERPAVMQELFGLMVVVFGGETFLGESDSQRRPE